jgi:hypothetical protein
MRIMKRSLPWVIGALVFPGCAMNLHDLRQQPPTRTATFADRQYDVLAGCVAEGLQMDQAEAGTLMYSVINRPEQRRIAITGWYVDRAWPYLDLLFIQRDGGVFIESRIGDVQGGEGGLAITRMIHKKAWPIIEECAGASPR